MFCVLLWSSAMRVHDSWASRKMVTRERIGQILEWREILSSNQTGFRLVNAAVVYAVRKIISGLEPSSLISYIWAQEFELSWLSQGFVTSTVRSSWIFILMASVCHQLHLLSTALYAEGWWGCSMKRFNKLYHFFFLSCQAITLQSA